MIAIYARVSTEEQGKKGYSIRNQIEECKNRAATNEVIEYVDKGYSGEFLERPALIQLRNDVKEGNIRKVICYDPDRLSRNLMNALIIDDEFRKKGVEMIYINGEYANSPDGKLFFSMRGAISEFEKAKINERMTSGRKKKAKEGKVVKNSHAYGYDYDKEKSRMVINEHEAKIVQMIYDQFTKGQMGMNSIAKGLTDKGIKTKKGKTVWHRNVIRQILMNETYIGKLYQNKWNTEGMLKNRYTDDPDEKVKIRQRPREEWIVVDVPQIISEEQFEMAQQLLEVTRRRFAKESKHNYLLSGLVRCAKCGNTMVGTRYSWWGERIFIYTDVKNSAGAKNAGCGTIVRTEHLDDAIWDEIKKILDNPDKIHEYNNEVRDMSREKNQIDLLTKEIEHTQKGRERLYTLITMGDDLDITEVKSKIVELQNKENNLNKEIEALNNEVRSIQNQQTDIEQVKESLKQFIHKGSFDFDDKKKLIRTLVKQIIVEDKDNVRIELF